MQDCSLYLSEFEMFYPAGNGVYPYMRCKNSHNPSIMFCCFYHYCFVVVTADVYFLLQNSVPLTLTSNDTYNPGHSTTIWARATATQFGDMGYATELKLYSTGKNQRNLSWHYRLIAIKCSEGKPLAILYHFIFIQNYPSLSCW